MLPRRIIAIAFLLAPVIAPASSGPAGISTSPIPVPADLSDSALPLHVPGYELRVLDRKKPVRFNVAGAWAETALPIFIYVPTGDPVRATALLRKAYDALLKLSLQPEWTAAEVRGVLTGLDQALDLLESDSTGVSSATTPEPVPAGSQPGAR